MSLVRVCSSNVFVFIKIKQTIRMEESEETVGPVSLPYVHDSHNESVVYYVIYILLPTFEDNDGNRLAVPIQSGTENITCDVFCLRTFVDNKFYNKVNYMVDDYECPLVERCSFTIVHT